MEITKKTATANTSILRGREIKFIVIHYTAGTTSRPGTAANVASFFSRTTTQASADYIVDDSTVVQYNPDIPNRCTWAVGGKRLANSLGGSLNGICTNPNSISVEMCSTCRTAEVKPPNHNDWQFTNAVLENTVELVRRLMTQYGIDADHVVRHYDVTGKLCPGVIGWNANSGSEATWELFKQRLVEPDIPQREEESEMTKEEVRTVVREEIATYMAALSSAQPEAGWQKEQFQRVTSLGITDGSRPMAFCSRMEAAIMAANAIKAVQNDL